MQGDAEQARFLRKRHAQQGLDQEQEQQEQQFGKNLQDALQQYGSKKNKKKDIQSQVQYFGNMIQPFNMREQQQMGNIDQEGYFVFKKRGDYKDAWLDSIEEGNDMMVADKVKKRIKTEGAGYKGVYEELQQQNYDKIKMNVINEQGEQDNEQEQEQKEDEHQQQQNQQQDMGLQPEQLKLLLVQLLPQNKSANAYVKQLKKNIKNPQNKQLHDKILELCNMYIQKTNQYDILTKKREELEIQVGDMDEKKSQELNWDQDQNAQQKNGQKQVKINECNRVKPKNQSNHPSRRDKDEDQHFSDDDIF